MNNKKLIISPFIVLGISTALIAGCIAFSIPSYNGFFIGIIFTMFVLLKSGYKFKDLLKEIYSAILNVRHLCAIIILIGATTSIWLASGVVPTIMYYGFTYMEGINFLLAAFVIMGIVSIFMGTSVGTISTVGISLLGIGVGMGIPSNIMVGVLISGGFLADKISPLSGLVNLNMTTVKKSYKETVRAMMITLIPTLIITGIIYYIIGAKYTAVDYSNLILYKEAISQGFNTSPILLLLPVIVLTLSVAGVYSLLTIGIGLTVGGIFSVVFQKMSVVEVLKGVIFGYHGATPSAKLNSMLVSGGMISMIEVILIVLGGVILVKLFQYSNILVPIMDKLMSGVKSRTSLIFRTGLMSMLLTVVTCDQTVGIILPGSVLQDKYKEFKLDFTVLTRTIADTGVIIAPLLPWDVNSFIIRPIVGIPTTSYSPYSVLCYICPIVTMIVAHILYGEKRKNKS